MHTRLGYTATVPLRQSTMPLFMIPVRHIYSSLPSPFIGHGFTFLSMPILSYFPEFRLVQLQLPIASRLKTKALIELTANTQNPTVMTYVRIPAQRHNCGSGLRLDLTRARIYDVFKFVATS